MAHYTCDLIEEDIEYLDASYGSQYDDGGNNDGDELFVLETDDQALHDSETIEDEEEENLEDDDATTEVKDTDDLIEESEYSESSYDENGTGKGSPDYSDGADSRDGTENGSPHGSPIQWIKKSAWDDRKTQRLLDLYQLIKHNLLPRTDIWPEVAKQMGLEGWTVTPTQCRNKLNSLELAYRSSLSTGEISREVHVFKAKLMELFNVPEHTSDPAAKKRKRSDDDTDEEGDADLEQEEEVQTSRSRSKIPSEIMIMKQSIDALTAQTERDTKIKMSLLREIRIYQTRTQELQQEANAERKRKNDLLEELINKL